MFCRLKTVYAVFKEELRAVLTDEGCALVMAGAVILYSVFYLSPFHNHIAREIPVGVIDNDNSVLSRRIIRALNADEMIKITARPHDLNEAKAMFNRGEIRAFIRFPRGFERDIKRYEPATATVYLDDSYLIIYKQLAAGVNEVFQAAGAAAEIEALTKGGLSKKQAEAVKLPADFIQVPLFNPAGSYQNYIYPMILIIILQQTMLIGIGMLCGTRHERGIKNKYGAAVTVPGRGLAYAGLYLVYAAVFFTLFPLIAVYPHSTNFAELLMFLIPFLLAAGFLGQCLAAVCKTRECSFFIMIPSSVPFIFLSGFVWPLEAIPPAVNLAARLVPSTSAIHGLVRLNQMGADFSAVSDDCLVLWCLCIFYFLLAVSVTERTARQ